ncbi:hypothetical protein AQJ67_33060 [Streptomyces caeruleatus]|uniref:Uncharacterized protein n=1 Tax=Streptomyces caeruleatus TaxID=661399 RepID=A0A117RKP5_9ACTN|nr:hypothetical protein AQJ67_33060 [Streptomyces caeruleatus]
MGGRQILLLGWVAHVLRVSSNTRIVRADTRVTAASQHSEDDDGTNYGAEADDANHKDNGAH